MMNGFIQQVIRYKKKGDNMSGFNTKEKNNNGDYEVTFYTDNYEDFKKVEEMCISLIGHNKQNE